MAYTKTQWVDDSQPAINATNLNKIEQGIYDADSKANAAAPQSTTYTKTEVDTALGGKVDKVTGKGLSTNDYTTAEKTKLSGIEANADVTDNDNVKTALIDTSATAWSDANKKTACGTIGAAFDGQYELIEEITLTEATNSITRTRDTGGNLYDFNKVYIFMDFPLVSDSTTTGLQLFFCSEISGSQYACSARQATISYSNKHYIFCLMEVSNSIWGDPNGAYYANGISSDQLRIYHYFWGKTPYNAGNAIKKIEFVSNTNLLTGTNIKIYAIRN